MKDVPRHFRIAALQNNFRSDEEAMKVIDTWADVGFDTEQFFHVCADRVSSVYDPAVHHDAVACYLSKAKKHGIKIIFYMNCHILNPGEISMASQWATRKIDGSYNMLYGTYYGTCLRSVWKEHFFDAVRALKEFDLAGIFFDGPIWGVKCACPVCRREFEAHYGKVFDEGTEAEHKEFDAWSVDTFKRELREVVKTTNPDWLMYFNEGLMAGRFDAEEMRRQVAYNDMIGTEHGGFFGHFPLYETWRAWSAAEGAKLAKAVGGDRPTVIFFAGDHKPWSWCMHTPVETKLTYASILGNGASVWYGLHNDPSFLQGEVGEALREMVKFDSEHTALYESWKSAADVAVFYSYNTAKYYTHTGIASDLYNDESRKTEHPGNYTEACRGAEALLEQTSMPWDYVTELDLERLKRYKVVLLPELAMIDDAVEAALKDYVAKGGIVIADGEFGFFDQHGAPREETALERLTGAVPTGRMFSAGHFNYFQFDALEDKTWLPLPAYVWELQPGTSESFAKAFHIAQGPYAEKPDTPNLPFGVSKKIGAGKVFYLAGGFYELYFNYRMQTTRRAFHEFLNSFYRPSFRLIGARSGISMTVGESCEGVVVHLTNFISPIWPIAEIAPIDGLKLEVPKKFTHASSLVTNESLTQDADGNWVLPTLQEYDVIVFREA